MSYSKIAIIENIIEEPSYENCKQWQEAIIEKANVIRSDVKPAQYCTIQEIKEMDLTKIMDAYLGLSMTREIQLDVDIYPEYEFNSMSENQLAEYLSQRDDLKSLLQGKQVMSVAKLQDGFMINAVDSRYYKKLTEHQSRLDEEASSLFNKSVEEPTEEIRNTI